MLLLGELLVDFSVGVPCLKVILLLGMPLALHLVVFLVVMLVLEWLLNLK
jgi:hypothetical protein